MAINAAVLNVLVTANTNQATRSMLRFNATMSATEASSNKALGAVKTLAKGATIGAGVGLAYAVKKAADFEQQLDSLGSVSGATGRQMEQFRKQAMKAGADTKFSALDAAQAQTELAKGGLNVRNIMRGGLRSALALAAAGEMDLADAAATTANAMNLFGLRGKDSIKVADQLATAANATTADVSDFAMALTQGGSVAKSAGLSFRETILALEALAKSGIKNSDAGTSLKTSLIQLLKPTQKQAELADKLNISFLDQEGHFKNLSSISDMLRDRLGGMTKAQRTATLATLAGTDGVRTLTAIYDAGSGRLDKWREGLSKSGTAADVAAKKQDNLKGKLENLQGSVETIAIAFGSKLLPALTKAAEDVTDVLNDQNLTGAEKFDQLGKMAADAIGKAGPVIGAAAAKVGLIAVQGFFNAFRNSPLWLKLLTAGFILSKLGGFGAFRNVGVRAGGAMAGGIAEGAAKSPATKGIAGRFAGLAGAFKSLGFSILGGALLAGVADAVTRQGISGIGDRVQQFASTSTFGLFPAPLDVDERLATITKKIRTWRSGILKLSDASDPDNSLIRQDDLGDFTGRQRQMLKGLAELRNTATRLFGTEFRLNAKMEFNPEAAAKRLRGLALEFDRMRQGAVLNVRQLREITTANFKRIADTMGVNSKQGTQALSRNFQLGLATIRGFQDRGVLTTKGAMREIARLLKSQSGAGKDALKTNMFAARTAIAQAMGGAVKVTDKGAGAIRKIFAQELKLYGLSSKEIGFRLEGREFSGKSTAPLVNKQRGGPINQGAPTGDTVPAMLERGEYVLNRKAVAKVGKQKLDAVNFAGAPRFQKGGMAGMVSAANQLDKAAFPYVWGGGHQGSPAPFGPMDCSGAVSYVLQHGGVQIPTMVSGALAGAGQPGPGKVTVFANAGHTFMRIGNRYFGTSGENPGGGAGWFSGGTEGWRGTFAQRHFAAAGGGLGRVPKISVGGPDSALRDVVQGALSKTRAAANRRMQDLISTSIGAGDAGDPGPFAGGASAQANRRLGKKMAARFGWTGAEWTALDKLWQGESGWINQMNQAGSGATGIPQALPGSKMASEGKDWATNPRTQIRWGLKYIKSVYGDPINAYNTWLARSPHWYAKGGAVGYVGDSLGQGTTPHLRSILDAAVHGNSVQGRSSASGVSALNGMLKGNQQFVFDLGTNDQNAGQTRSSLHQFGRKVGERPLHFLTVKSPFDAENKNKVFRQSPGGNEHLIDWAKIAGQYGATDSQPHPNAAGYQKRAQMLAASIRRHSDDAQKQKGKGGKSGHAGPAFGGPLGKVLTKTLKALRSSKSAKVRGTRLRQFEKRVRQLGLPEGLRNQLAFLGTSAETLGSRADNAAQLNVENDDGTTTLGFFQGKDEGGWLNDQLTVLLKWRNKMLDGIKITEKRRKEVAKLLDRARKRLKAVAEQIRQAAKRKREFEKLLEQAKNHPKKVLDGMEKQLAVLRLNPKANKAAINTLEKQIARVKALPDNKNDERIKLLKAAIHDIDEKQKPRARERKLLDDRIIPALSGRRKDLGTLYGTLTGTEGLEQVQGPAGPLTRIKGVPPLGTLGGSIFDVQLRLRDLLTPATAQDNESATTDDSASVELLKQLLREANQRTAVSQAQYDIFKNFDATSGAGLQQFATGGIVQAPAGAPLPVIAHGGEGVFTREQMAAMGGGGSGEPPIINVNVIVQDGAVDKNKIRTEVEQVTRQMARHGGRRLPGGGGGR